MSTTWINTSDSRTSSKVDLNESTKWWGSFRINPTVSESRKGKFPTTTFRTVVSNVANSLFSANTSDLVNRFIKVDFPTLVYPTNAALIICSRPFRWVAFCLSIFLSLSFNNEILSRIIRLSVSISVSPGPRIPIPPFWRERWVHILVNRGNRYSYWASSTWVLASAVLALFAKMSKIKLLRSSILVFSAFSMFLNWEGLNSSSKITIWISCVLT